MMKIQSLITLYSLASLPAMAADYYVSAAGSDTNPGTSAAPWRTIAKVNSATLAAGDTIHFRCGDTWRETLVPQKSGSATAKVTYTSYDTGAKPVISGAEVITGPWTLHSGGTANTYVTPLAAQTMMVTRSNSYIKKGGSINTLAVNQYRWEAGMLYINIGSDPSASLIEVGQRSNGVAPANGRNHVTLRDLRIEKTNISNIRVVQGSFWIVEDCEIYYGNSNSAAAGGAVNGDQIHDAIIRRNHISYSLGDGVMAWRSARVEVSGNLIENVLDDGGSGGADGIQIGAKVSTPNACDGFKIINNVVSRPSTEVQKGCIIQEMGDNGIISGNICTKGRFGLSSSGNNNVVEHNYVTGFGTAGGIRVSQDQDMANMKIRYNIVTQSPGFAGITILNDQALDPDDPTPPTPKRRSNFEIHNNVVYNTYYGIVAGSNFSGSIRNNIVWSPGSNPRVRISAGTILPGETITVSHNILKDATTESMVSISGTSYYDLPSLQASPYGAGTSIADPLFVNAATQDFHVKPGSPTIDAGVDVGLTEDYEGNPVPGGVAPDIGAYETMAVYEGFNQPAGTIDGANGGTGWGGPWTVAGGAGGNAVTGGGFTYTGLPVSGNRLQLFDTDGVFQQVTRPLANTWGYYEGTYWISFLAKKVNTAREAYLYFNGLNFRAYQANAWQVKTPGTAYTTLTGAGSSSLHLFVVRVDSGATNDTVRVWVDPVISAGEPAPGSALVTLTDPGTFNVSQVTISHGPFGSATQCGEWDEIRLGTSFQAVTAP